jgi:hypothetical protein
MLRITPIVARLSTHTATVMTDADDVLGLNQSSVGRWMRIRWQDMRTHKCD